MEFPALDPGPLSAPQDCEDQPGKSGLLSEGRVLNLEHRKAPPARPLWLKSHRHGRQLRSHLRAKPFCEGPVGRAWSVLPAVLSALALGGLCWARRWGRGGPPGARLSPGALRELLCPSLSQRAGLRGRKRRLESRGCVLSINSATSPGARREVQNLDTKATGERESKHTMRDGDTETPNESGTTRHAGEAAGESSDKAPNA